MSGLTSEGFTILTLDEIKTSIKDKLEILNPGFDFSPESPDGQNVEIYGFMLSQLWTQLDLVYRSFDPSAATGQGLTNIGLISGIQKDNADRSTANVSLVGVSGTFVPAISQVSDTDGNKYVTEFDAVIPATVSVIALVAGPTPILAGAINTIVSPVTGWNSVTQAEDGRIGSEPETEQHYRTDRTRAVMNPSESVTDALRAKLIELGVGQVAIANNDTVNPLEDGTPAGAIHITITDSILTDEEVAAEILKYKSLGTYTFGSTAVVTNDSQGGPHTISFTRSAEVVTEIALNITFLDTDISGAETEIKNALSEYVNKLVTGADVIWSHLFGLITPHGGAQVNSLTIGKLGDTLVAGNLEIGDIEFATLAIENVAVTYT